MAFFPTDPRNEYMQQNHGRKLHTKREKAKSNLMVISIQPQALWKEEVRICLANGFLLMDKNLPAKYIEAIYELEYDHAARCWKQQLFYHQLAARCVWQGCKFGQPAKIEAIVEAICEEPTRRAAMVQECEQNVMFRRECHKEARQRPPDVREESCFPGLSLRRCPACLGAVPKQSIRCLLCWGYLLSEEEGLEGLQPAEGTGEEPAKSENIVLTRRASQDIELNMHGEIIQTPCLDVQRFQRENRLKESPVGDGADRAQGTVEQIANIQSCSWNKHWKKAYAHDFTSNEPNPSNRANFDKFQSFLQNRLGAWQSSMERIFGLQCIGIQEGEMSCKFRLTWRSFDEQALPRITQRSTAWSNNQARWKTAYHGTRLE